MRARGASYIFVFHIYNCHPRAGGDLRQNEAQRFHRAPMDAACNEGKHEKGALYHSVRPTFPRSLPARG
ncbi:hypothetical protein KL86PLE_90570 [uncultured Pleomorphomonas sp.]|uniref:Uncharacterized protein n=1 Tax=uncultured Pleomorphomonas sp. TaxID=442121 RepID=A0A212LQ46_9HYPH|nr:hypothetical protein KL86PLE_90570 [uncultured Pleomorphomonas sp.]